MTAAEAQQLIGLEGNYDVGKMVVRVAVADVKTAYGRTDLLIYPLAGSGRTWVSHLNVTLDKKSARR